VPPESFDYYPTGETALDRCRAYVVTELRRRPRAWKRSGPPSAGPAVTISYEAGAGAHQLAPRLGAVLQKAEPGAAQRWTIFDRQLIDEVLAEHHLPKELGRLMPEDRRSYIQDLLDDQMGTRPPSWVLVPKITETVLHLANAGRVILVGRGANIITQRMPNVFHVRLIGSLPRRIERAREMGGLSQEAAARFVHDEDRAHSRYARAHFHALPSDDHLYHLIVNTDDIPVPDAARLIADAALRLFRRQAKGRA
jgi:cytidylate kinase